MNAQTIALVTMIGAVVTPPLTSLLKNETWPTQIKQLVCLLVSAAVASVAIEIDQPALFHTTSFATLIGLIFSAATMAYGLLFSGSTFNAFLTQLGKKPPAA